MSVAGSLFVVSTFFVLCFLLGGSLPFVREDFDYKLDKCVDARYHHFQERLVPYSDFVNGFSISSHRGSFKAIISDQNRPQLKFVFKSIRSFSPPLLQDNSRNGFFTFSESDVHYFSQNNRLNCPIIEVFLLLPKIFVLDLTVPHASHLFPFISLSFTHSVNTAIDLGFLRAAELSLFSGNGIIQGSVAANSLNATGTLDLNVFADNRGSIDLTCYKGSQVSSTGFWITKKLIKTSVESRINLASLRNSSTSFFDFNLHSVSGETVLNVDSDLSGTVDFEDESVISWSNCNDDSVNTFGSDDGGVNMKIAGKNRVTGPVLNKCL
ncbi:hypothetical protein RCL1_001433 [Eukaryota sp. TZLM3-RCL]